MNALALLLISYLVISMKKLGKAIIATRNKNILVKIKRKIQLGLRVYNDKMRNIGFVYDIIGPINNPYAVIKVNISKIKPETLVGKILYIEDRKRWKNR